MNINGVFLFLFFARKLNLRFNLNLIQNILNLFTAREIKRNWKLMKTWCFRKPNYLNVIVIKNTSFQLYKCPPTKRVTLKKIRYFLLNIWNSKDENKHLAHVSIDPKSQTTAWIKIHIMQRLSFTKTLANWTQTDYVRYVTPVFEKYHRTFFLALFLSCLP